MITRTEVEEVIRRCETQAGWSPLDKGSRAVSAGDLHVLIEAAKAAQYSIPSYPHRTEFLDPNGHDDEQPDSFTRVG